MKRLLVIAVLALAGCKPEAFNGTPAERACANAFRNVQRNPSSFRLISINGYGQQVYLTAAGKNAHGVTVTDDIRCYVEGGQNSDRINEMWAGEEQFDPFVLMAAQIER